MTQGKEQYLSSLATGGIRRIVLGELVSEKAFKVFREFGNIQLSLVPLLISRPKSVVVGGSVFADSLWDYLVSGQ